MTPFLDSIRSKPKAARKQIAFAGAFVATSVVALVWVSTLPQRYQMVPVDAVVAESSEATGLMRQFFSGVREQVAAVGTVLSTTTDDPATTTATTSAAVTATTATTTATTTPQIVVPQLNQDNINTINPRIIQIATSSAQ